MLCESGTIALISAGTALLGASIGAAGAIVGPWLVRRSEKKQLERENMRAAIVDFANKKLISMHAFNQARFSGSFDDAVQEKLMHANISANSLYSLIDKEDSHLKDWINRMGKKAISIPITTTEDLIKIDVFISQGIQYIISWHSGEISTDQLKPFGLNSKLEPRWLDSWDSEWPTADAH